MNEINLRDLSGAIETVSRSGVSSVAGIKSEEQGFKISVANHDERLEIKVPGSNGGALSAYVEIKSLRELLRIFPSGARLELSAIDGSLFLKQLNGSIVESICTVQPPASCQDFPVATEYKAIPGLLESLSDASFAAGKTDIRKVMNGILIEADAVVATNGRELICQAFKTGADAQYVLPVTKTLKCSMLANDTVVAYSRKDETGFCHFRNGRIDYSVRCINGIYPQYKQVIPTEDSSWSKAVIADALLPQRIRALELAYGKQHDTELTLCLHENSISIKSAMEDIPELSIKSEISSKGNASIRLKAGQLLYALKHAYIGLSFSDGKYAPALFADGKGRKFVFMASTTVKKEVAVENVKNDSSRNMPVSQDFKVIPAETKTQDIFDELTLSVEELRQHFRVGLECLTQLSRKIRDGRLAQKQREKEFKDTRDIIEKLKKASGF